MTFRRMVTLGLLALGLGVVLTACGDDAEPADFAPITVIVDESQVSPLDGADTAETPGGETAAYAPLDLSFLGDNVSSSAVPSAIPEGLEVGFTDEGYPYRGSPDAPVKLFEYSDYACPFCGRYTSLNVPELLTQYGVSGDVQFIFREFPLTSIHPTAPTVHVAAYCAGEQSAELYWEMHDAIFAGQADWTNLPDPSGVMRTTAEGIGVDMEAFEECTASGRGETVVDAGVADAQALGFNGTPSFQIEGEGVEGVFDIIGAQPVDVFFSYIDSLLAGEAPSDPSAPPDQAAPPEDTGLPFWVNPESGLLADPERPGVTAGGDFYKGNPDATVVVVEISDFECPFCRQHTLEVQPTIDAELVETGEIMWVYKHLPLSIHPYAPAASAASECAGDQGRFWDMHDVLFETVERWATDDADAELLAIAGELGLDAAAFETCFNGRDALERVLNDLADAEDVASSTPTFLIIRNGQGFRITGSRDADAFVQLLRSQIEAEAEESAGG